MKVAIAHAPLANRKPTLERLLAQLAPQNVEVHIQRSRRMEHAAIWSYRLWEWCEAQDDDCILLNDDVFVSPDLVTACRIICDLPTSPIVALHTSVPEAKPLADAGGRWLRAYWQTGPGYLFKRGAASPLLDYVARLPWKFRSSYNEDNVSQHFAWEKQEPFHSTIPALVLHDTNVPSSLAYDNHPNRTTCVPWTNYPHANLADVARWREGLDTAPYVSNPWMSEQYMEQVRRGLRMQHPCDLCFQREAVVGHMHSNICGGCLGTMVSTVFQTAEVRQ